MATEETVRRRAYQCEYHEKRRDEYNERSRAWYYEHRKEVLRKHKERMATDPEYRVRKKAIQKRADAKQYAKRKPVPKPPCKPKKPQSMPKHKPVSIMAETASGKYVRVYPLSEVSDIIGKKYATIYSWRRRKLIPQSLWHPHKLYTEDQISMMKILAALPRKHREVRSAFVKVMYANWG